MSSDSLDGLIEFVSKRSGVIRDWGEMAVAYRGFRCPVSNSGFIASSIPTSPRMNKDVGNQTVRQFITHHFSQAHTRSLADDDPLLESGIVDSLGVSDLVSFIQSEFNITVEEDELIPEHFNSISKIVEYVRSKQKRPGISAGSA